MLTVYNPEIGDCLIVMLKSSENQEVLAETKGDITRTYTESGTVGFNFFKVEEKFQFKKAGQIFLNPEEVAELNTRLKAAGFSEKLEVDVTPKIVVGEVLSLTPHPDSDHLSITQTKVSENETIQIVCGAPNVAVGQKVVAALPGAMMPDGTVIWPGSLRGVESFGMLCSARELHLPHAPEKKGILVLADDTPVGVPFGA